MGGFKSEKRNMLLILIYVILAKLLFFVSFRHARIFKICSVLFREPFKLLFTTQTALIKQNIHVILLC